MYHLCLIPGLGVDERLFRHLKLDNRYGQTILRWISPEPNETLEQYARRMAKQIPPGKDKLILIGVSFGGIMAVEMAKFLNPKLTIIISSIKTKAELPWYFKLAGWLKLPMLLPLQLGKYFYGLQTYLFGAQTPEEANLLHQIIHEIDLPYLRWALMQIANWQQTKATPNLVHLHGTHDKIFPVQFLNNYIPVPGGEHLMIISQADRLIALIDAEINKLPGMAA